MLKCVKTRIPLYGTYKDIICDQGRRIFYDEYPYTIIDKNGTYHGAVNKRAAIKCALLLGVSRYTHNKSGRCYKV